MNTQGNFDRFKRRVWDKKRGRMHYGDMDNLMFGLGGMLFWQFAYGSPEPISIDEREDYIPMGCTGLKDSTKWEELTLEEQEAWCRHSTPAEWKGRLIYEGDFICIESEPLYSIRWCDSGGGFEFFVYEDGERKEAHSHFTRHDAERAKVLGNIYEHPSLLEVEK